MEARTVPQPAPAHPPHAQHAQHAQHARLRVYLIDDDDDLREDTCYCLTQKGFQVSGFASASDFWREQAVRPCDVAIIDIGLPGEDGLSIAAHLRRASPGGIGILMLTARGQLEDRLEGLKAGADHYMVKPFNLDELTLQLRAIARRLARDDAAPPAQAAPAKAEKAPPEPPPARPPAAPRWRLEESGCVLVDPGGLRMVLTTAERNFIGALLRQPGEGVDRTALLIAMGATALSDPKRVDAVARRLRQKVAEHGLTLPLHTVRGTGYMMSFEVDGEAG